MSLKRYSYPTLHTAPTLKMTVSRPPARLVSFFLQRRRYHPARLRNEPKSLCSSCSPFPRRNASFTAQVQVAPINTVRINHHASPSNCTEKEFPEYSPEEDQAFVDELIHGTHELMNHQELLQQEAGKHHYHLVAFSGGIDSSLVACLLQTIFNAKPKGNNTVHLRAVLGLSPAVPADQVELAERVARHIGIELQQVPTQEGDDPTYLANNGYACRACKTHLYSTLQRIVTDHQLSSSSSFTLYNGTNADDLTDPTRVGLLAAQEFSVHSPLQHLSKQQVRRAALKLGLFNWNYAASPCLRSRLALGVPATKEHLVTMERAESFVRERMETLTGWDETNNMRVRLLSKNRACIEVDTPFLEEAKKWVEERDEWESFFLEELGFSSVQVRAFRSGSVSARKGAE